MVIRPRGTSFRSRTYHDTLHWLIGLEDNWLLILDAADDATAPIFQYVPECGHGNIIITSRDTTRRLFAPNSTHMIEGLSIAESISLILTISQHENNPSNKAYAEAIARALGSHPSALVHAGAYISLHPCLSAYLDMYNHTRPKFLRLPHPILGQDYQHSLAETVDGSIISLKTRRTFCRY